MYLENSADAIRLIRKECLKRLKNEDMAPQEYRKIISFLNSPHNEINHIDFTKINFDEMNSITNSTLIDICISILYEINKKDKRFFSKKYKKGQYIVWRNVFSCAKNLISIRNNLNSLNYEIKESDYLDACSIIKEHLEYLANAFREMTLFEKKMGVERYLATSGLENDIKILHELLNEIRDCCNYKLEAYVPIFRLKWNLTSVSKAIKKSLDVDLIENEVSYSISKGHKNVLFFLLDGFGYTQYLWFLSGLKKHESVTYSINIFDWLQNFDEYNDELILSSNLITDTGSCLATIFSGQLPSKTGILASKVVSEGRIENIKKLKGMDLLAFTKNYPNSFFDDLKSVETLVLNGSGFPTRDRRENYTGYIYGDSKLIFVNPADRIFQTLSDNIDPESDKQFISTYFPLIDRTGHAIGAFTSFESYEYEKLNILFVDFLLDLAYNKKEIFDGKTKIIISADHGMFETSSKYVSFREIIAEFDKNHKRRPKVVINNRSIILYQINQRDLEDSKKIIVDLLNNKLISHEIYSDEDESVKEMFPDFLRDDYQNTLVVLFKGDGIAVQHDMEKKMLHYGGHGGCSCEEVFVPLITLELTPKIHDKLIDHFSKLK